MSQETIILLLEIVGLLALGANAGLAFLFLRGYQTFAKFTGVKQTPEEEATTHRQLVELAHTVVAATRERLEHWIEGQAAPKTGEEKQALALASLKSLAPPALKFTDEQAKIALDAAVQQQRSLMPPAPTPSMVPPADPEVAR